MLEFLSAFGLIFIAEMGDKTQLLALAFSTKYKTGDVLKGVFAGAFLNHALAILFASFISRYASLNNIQLIASFIFLVFGFLSLVVEYEDEDEKKEKSFSNPILAVAAAFFIGELGDKTQLTAMALGAGAKSPFMILLGTSLSMVAVSYVGIYTGKVLGKKIPEITMKMIAAVIFLIFGFSGLYSFLPSNYINIGSLILVILLTVSIIAWIFKLNIENREYYYTKKLSNLISLCSGCSRHDPECERAIEINKVTHKYLGQEVPFLGDVIGYVESLKNISPQKSEKIKKLFG